MILEACTRLIAGYRGKGSTLFPVYGVKDVPGLHAGPEAGTGASAGTGCGRDARAPRAQSTTHQSVYWCSFVSIRGSSFPFVSFLVALRRPSCPFVDNSFSLEGPVLTRLRPSCIIPQFPAEPFPQSGPLSVTADEDHHQTLKPDPGPSGASGRQIDLPPAGHARRHRQRENGYPGVFQQR